MLQEGDILSLEDGREVPVQSIETITYNHYVNVYNFEVKDFHIYYISDVSVLVQQNTMSTIKEYKYSETVTNSSFCI